MEIDPSYLKRRLEFAIDAGQYFRALFTTHSRRHRGFASCLDRFRSSVDALRQQPTVSALAAVEECHNELCIAEELLLCAEHPFSLVEYEAPLPNPYHEVRLRLRRLHISTALSNSSPLDPSPAEARRIRVIQTRVDPSIHRLRHATRTTRTPAREISSSRMR